MEFKNTRVYDLEESIKASGYPMLTGDVPDLENIRLTDKDRARAFKLANTKPGSGHNNYMKGILVSFDMKYPEYIAPQLQRYNFLHIVSSQSKMHKLTAMSLSASDFTPQTPDASITICKDLIQAYKDCNGSRKTVFAQLVSALPMGYMKWMRVTTNYMQLATIYRQRENHKLEDWSDFRGFIKTLPMHKLITNE